MKNILLTFLLGTNVFWFAYSFSIESTYKHKTVKALRLGFADGCDTAFRAAGRVSDGDPLEDMYTEWCTNAADRYGQKIGMKK